MGNHGRIMSRKDDPEILSYEVFLWKLKNKKTWAARRAYRIRIIPLKHLQNAIDMMAEWVADLDGVSDHHNLALDLLYKELARRA